MLPKIQDEEELRSSSMMYSSEESDECHIPTVDEVRTVTTASGERRLQYIQYHELLTRATTRSRFY
jgi:hypothetical protein